MRHPPTAASIGAEDRPLPKRRKVRFASVLAALALVLGACGDDPDAGPTRLTILSHESFDDGVTSETFAAFTAVTGIEVVVIASSDAGAMVNQAILTKDNPLADVIFGVDDTFLSRAIDGGIFLAHEAAGLAEVDPRLVHPGNLVTPISYGDVCINYDKAWFSDSGLSIPTTLEDLRDPDVASLLAVMHPATSSPGLAFLLATVDAYGEEGWQGFWADLRDGGVTVTSGWSAAYYGEFSRYDGDRPLVLSYASSPPVEVFYADPPIDEAPTGVITDGCYRQIEFAGVLEGTEYPEAAGALVDFMLSLEFQNQIPESWLVYPANSQATLPPAFAAHTVLPDDPSQFDTDYISSNRERWINEWISVMEGR